MPPEYILEGILSMKHDVYSFGVIILETISGMSKGDEPAQHHVSISWVSKTFVSVHAYMTHHFVTVCHESFT